MDWSINFRNTDFGCAQRFGRHDHQICIWKTSILDANFMLNLTPMEAKYTRLDNLVPRYHLFDNN